MSLGLLANDLLIDLANLGGKAEVEVGAQVRALLAKPPGPWLPESYDAAYELLRRAFRDASRVGKKVLSKVTTRIVEVLSSTLAMKKLTDDESRQLLGAMAALGRFGSGVDASPRKPIDSLVIATFHPTLFWERVTPAQEIVGKSEEDREAFINFLKVRLLSPEDARGVSVATRFVIRAAPHKKATGYAARLRYPNGHSAFLAESDKNKLDRRVCSLSHIRNKVGRTKEIRGTIGHCDEVNFTNFVQTRLSRRRKLAAA